METPSTSSSSSSSSSFVSKAKTAFHSAAAKAERVLTDIKIDLKSDPPQEESEEEGQSDKPSSKKVVSELKSTSNFRDGELGRKQDWHKRLKNIRRGKTTGPEEEEKKKRLTSPNSRSNSPGIDEYLDQMDLRTSFELKGSEKVHPVEKEDSNMPSMVTIPPASVIKQLAVAVEAGKKFKSMKDLLASARDSSPIRERAGLSFSAMKSLVLRDKEGKLNSDGDDDEVVSLSKKLFNVEGQFCIKKNQPGSAISSLPRDIHAAPLDSFVVGLAEIIGRLTKLRKMASFWYKVVKELRRLWSEEQPIPRVPLDENPDLNSCLLHQQLQVINCCISRKRRYDIATELMDSILREVGLNLDELVLSPDLAASSSVLYARINNGDLVLRLGADHPSESITMLETGEPVYSPVTQEGPVLTEDLIKETEELVLRTGSVGAGCSQLLSDMQAFKAANPGCILEDFVRWHSPPDWSETDTSDETKDCSDEGEPPSRKGYLSTRMQKEGNLWRELWDTSKPLPAIKQAPLFDEDLAVEGILDFFEEITPSELFQQLFISLLASGLVIAEGPLSMNSNFSKLFYECKDYVIATCQVNTWSDNVDNLCQVYETVETILVHPEDGLKIINQSEEATADEPKRRFRKLIFNFGGKDRQFLRKQGPKQTKNPEENSARQGFQNLFDGKSSLFSKKPPTPKTSNPPSQNDTSFYSDEIIGQAFQSCKYSI